MELHVLCINVLATLPFLFICMYILFLSNEKSHEWTQALSQTSQKFEQIVFELVSEIIKDNLNVFMYLLSYKIKEKFSQKWKFAENLLRLRTSESWFCFFIWTDCMIKNIRSSLLYMTPVHQGMSCEVKRCVFVGNKYIIKKCVSSNL